MVPAELVSLEASLSTLQMAAFWQCPHVAFPLCAHIPDVSLCVVITSPSKDTSQIGLGPTLVASF